jgi:CheY-like chemotaxis protein
MPPRSRTTLPLVQPIVPVLRGVPLDDPAWLFEPKYDGFRGLLYVGPRHCWFRSKRGNTMTRFQQLAEAILCRLTVRLLADEGFVAVALQSPRAALDLLAGEAQANLLIADVLMPEMKGPRFVRLARELRPTLPVLLVSGFPAPEETDMRALQAYAFLPKIFTQEQLGRAVRQLLI